jgi:hypothetical protein
MFFIFMAVAPSGPVLKRTHTIGHEASKRIHYTMVSTDADKDSSPS